MFLVGMLEHMVGHLRGRMVFLVGMLEHMVGNVTQPILLPLHVEKEPSRGTCAIFFLYHIREYFGTF